MHTTQRSSKPVAPRVVEQRHGRLEIALVLRLVRVLRLEQQHDLRPAVWNPVVGSLDQRVVRHPNRGVAPADPRAAVRRLSEQVEPPLARRRLADPRLMRVEQAVARLPQRCRFRAIGDNEDLELVEHLGDFVEARVRDRELEVAVLAPLLPTEQVERPPGRDVPRHTHAVQQAREVVRPPGLPLRNVRMDRAHERNCGSTFSANSRICSCRFAPHSSSMTCVQPASRYSSIAATQSPGVPAIGLPRSRIESVTCSFPASRPPRSIASATGRISSTSMFARSSSVSAAPLMFCTLLARYIPAISRAPSRPSSRSSAIDATIVQPMSISAFTFSRVWRTNGGVVIDGVRQPSPISPESACIFGAVAPMYT